MQPRLGGQQHVEGATLTAFLWVSAFLVLCQPTPPRPESGLVGRPITGVHVLEGSGYWFKLSFDTASPSRSGGDGWGQIDYQPCTRLFRLKGKFKGVELHLKQSCYGDLYDVTSADLRPLKGGACLVLKGGDAGGAFTAKLYFDHFAVTERIVRDAEFPDALFERTAYHWVRGTS